MPLTAAALKAAIDLAKSFDFKAGFAKPDMVGQSDFNLGVKQVDFYADGDISGTTLSVHPHTAPNAGLYFPWLEQQRMPGSQDDESAGKEGYTSLGSFTRPIADNDILSWAVTGPFSGCHASVYSSGAGFTFCHLVTGGSANTKDPDVQRQGIAAALGVGSKEVSSRHLTAKKRRDLGNVQGFSFWMRLEGRWHQRTIWVERGKIPYKIAQKDEIKAVQ